MNKSETVVSRYDKLWWNQWDGEKQPVFKFYRKLPQSGIWVPVLRHKNVAASLKSIRDRQSSAINTVYLWRATMAPCSFSFSACVMPRNCQACKKKCWQAYDTVRVNHIFLFKNESCHERHFMNIPRNKERKHK